MFSVTYERENEYVWDKIKMFNNCSSDSTECGHEKHLFS